MSTYTWAICSRKRHEQGRFPESRVNNTRIWKPCKPEKNVEHEYGSKCCTNLLSSIKMKECSACWIIWIYPFHCLLFFFADEGVHSAGQFCNPNSNKWVALLWILGWLWPICFIWEEDLQKPLNGVKVAIDVLWRNLHFIQTTDFPCPVLQTPKVNYLYSCDDLP